ncbi:hypothetical protein CVT24_001237 [Panaeolus cyanescens]|uniref:HNH nuclease domain-containing protein n=1 Tax=Panaeolus cyanescens TaxID=181874 RepID=A0A409YYW1_9AGAR|nr:hypothetical protein CVT24_001237 [Panaeolus cyanescens]
MAYQDQLNFKLFDQPGCMPMNPFQIDIQPSMYNAYQRCVEAFDRETLKGNDKRHYIAFIACLLFYLTEENVTGRKAVCKDVSAAECQSDEQLINLGIFYVAHLVETFHRRKTSASSTGVYHPIHAFKGEAEDLIPFIDLSTSYQHKQTKQMALSRDRCHCLLTGQYDPEHIGSLGLSDSELLRTKHDGSSAKTNLVHIFPRTLTENFNPRKNSPKLEWIARVWHLVQRLWNIDMRDQHGADKLTGDGIHQLRNVLTLSVGIHASFDELSVWCNSNKDSKENHYFVEAIYPIDMLKIRPDFSTMNPEFVNDVPSRKFLKVHAVICQAFQHSQVGSVHYNSKDISTISLDDLIDLPVGNVDAPLESPDPFNRLREPIPSNPFIEIGDPERYMAYNRCLNLCSSLNTDQERELELARVLIFLMLEAPCEEGCLFICKEINLCRFQDELYRLAEVYIKYMVAVSKGSTFRDHYEPHPVNTEEYDDQMAQFMEILASRRTANISESFKSLIMKRDYGRCLLTKKYDPVVHQKRVEEITCQGGTFEGLDLCHIFPQFLMDKLRGAPDSEKRCRYTAKSFMLLQSYSGLDLADFYQGTRMHSPGNVLTLTKTVHGAFDSLSLWLRPINIKEKPAKPRGTKWY